jgi:hypothetical protein
MTMAMTTAMLCVGMATSMHGGGDEHGDDINPTTTHQTKRYFYNRYAFYGTVRSPLGLP